eukprot:1136304-Pelagomonas_calceolata.AAC.3
MAGIDVDPDLIDALVSANLHNQRANFLQLPDALLRRVFLSLHGPDRQALLASCRGVCVCVCVCARARMRAEACVLACCTVNASCAVHLVHSPCPHISLWPPTYDFRKLRVARVLLEEPRSLTVRLYDGNEPLVNTEPKLPLLRALFLAPNDNMPAFYQDWQLAAKGRCAHSHTTCCADLRFVCLKGAYISTQVIAIVTMKWLTPKCLQTIWAQRYSVCAKAGASILSLARLQSCSREGPTLRFTSPNHEDDKEVPGWKIK